MGRFNPWMGQILRTECTSPPCPPVLGMSPLPSAGGFLCPVPSVPWSWSQPGRASAQEPKMPLVPRASLTYLGIFFLFFHLIFPGWQQPGRGWRAPLSFPCHSAPARSDIYFRCIKLTCHHHLNLSASKFSFCHIPDL